MPLSDGQVSILENLAKYKFLTTSQLIYLGTYKNIRRLRESISALAQRTHPLVTKIVYPPSPHGGRVENLHHLTQNGVNFLIEELGYYENDIRYTKNTQNLMFRDYHHRVNTIYTQIFATQWADKNNIEIDIYDSYFDKDGANNTKISDKLPSRAKPKIDIDEKLYLIPDSVFLFKHNGRDNLFLIEIQNGLDTGLLLKKIRLHQTIISRGLASLKYGLDYDNKSLFLFQLQESKDALLNRIHTLHRIENFKNHFLFKTLDEATEDFYTGWTQIDGNTTNLI